MQMARQPVALLVRAHPQSQPVRQGGRGRHRARAARIPSRNQSRRHGGPEFKLKAAALKEANEEVARLIQSGGMKHYARWVKEQEESLKDQDERPKSKKRK
jgi:hypothetical protein